MAPKSGAGAKVRQVLRDPEHADFLVEQIDALVDYIKKEIADDPAAAATNRPRVRRLRLIQKSLSYNAAQTRERSGEAEIGDEF